jgi:hypothetical protein
MNWQFIANGVGASNPLWSTIPADGTAWTGAPGSWAADVIKLKNGKYHFYYRFCGTGRVTRLDRNSPDANVTLTATITLNGMQTTKMFDVTVRSLAPPQPIAAYDFENDLNASRGMFGPGVVIGARADAARAGSTQPAMLWSGTA